MELERVQGVRLSHPLWPNYSIFMEKFKLRVENEHPLVDLNPPLRNPGSTPGHKDQLHVNRKAENLTF